VQYDPFDLVAYLNAANEHAAVSSHDPSAHKIAVAIANIGVTTIIRVAVPGITVTWIKTVAAITIAAISTVPAVATKEAMTTIAPVTGPDEPTVTAKSSAMPAEASSAATESSATTMPTTTVLGGRRRSGGGAKREHRNADYQSFVESRGHDAFSVFEVTYLCNVISRPVQDLPSFSEQTFAMMAVAGRTLSEVFA
jgi:hypothetical protein